MVDLACCEVIVIWGRTEDNDAPLFFFKPGSGCGIFFFFFSLELELSHIELVFSMLRSACPWKGTRPCHTRGDVRPPLLTDRLQTKDYGGAGRGGAY